MAWADIGRVDALMAFLLTEEPERLRVLGDVPDERSAGEIADVPVLREGGAPDDAKREFDGVAGVVPRR
ncbi:hypothetical protein [Actinomadura miaoliensis]|uniref:hypothetical protein n=1 Tax=Actinomadura miaoliensis TaxID=430685 RepID=UPI0031E95068